MDTASLGSDVAKAQVDSAVRPSGAQWVRAKDEAGSGEGLARVPPLQPPLIVLEATGGREIPVAAPLVAAGLPVAVVNPRPVRAFARASGHLATTAALDAAVLARLAEVVRPASRPLPDAQTQELAALLARRRQLGGLLSAERQRLETALPALRPPLQRHLAWLEQELRQLDGTLRERVQGSPLWREQEDLLRSVPGSGPTTAFTLLAEWPQLGRLDRQALAALVGVAPLNGASGTLRGRRIVWGGRARVRSARYMAALVASRHQPVIRAFSERWCAAGTPKQLAVTACRHQLLTLLNARVRHHTPWRVRAIGTA